MLSEIFSTCQILTSDEATTATAAASAVDRAHSPAASMSASASESTTCTALPAGDAGNTATTKTDKLVEASSVNGVFSTASSVPGCSTQAMSASPLPPRPPSGGQRRASSSGIASGNRRNPSNGSGLSQEQAAGFWQAFPLFKIYAPDPAAVVPLTRDPKPWPTSAAQGSRIMGDKKSWAGGDARKVKTSAEKAQGESRLRVSRPTTFLVAFSVIGIVRGEEELSEHVSCTMA